MKKPTIKELIQQVEEKDISAEWDRKKDLLTRFNGLRESTLNGYQSEMEKIPEFAEGILKPGHSTTFINLAVFLWFLKWKDANLYKSKKIPPKEVTIPKVPR